MLIRQKFHFGERFARVGFIVTNLERLQRLWKWFISKDFRVPIELRPFPNETSGLPGRLQLDENNGSNGSGWVYNIFTPRCQKGSLRLSDLEQCRNGPLGARQGLREENTDIDPVFPRTMTWQSVKSCVVPVHDVSGEVKGTGFFISSEGHFLTCAHVVDLAGGWERVRIEGRAVTLAYAGDPDRK